MKLQEAYASENNDVGTWAQIGYKGPGEYKSTASSESGTFKYNDDNADGKWKAEAKVALNDCVNGTWSLTTQYTDGNITTTATSSSKDNCVTPLVPNYCKIATSGDCS